MTHRPIPEKRRHELAVFIPDLAEARRKLGPSPDAYAERHFWTEHVLDIRKVSSRGPTDAAERLWLFRHAHLAATGADPIRLPGFLWPGFCARMGPTAANECWPLEPIPGAKVPPSAPPNECSVVIDDRVVKPGDVLYYKPGQLLREFDGQVRTVSRTGSPNKVWFTNGYWAPAADLTFVAPADSDVKRTSLHVFNDFMHRCAAELIKHSATPLITVNRTAFQQFQMQIQAAPTHSQEHTMTQATAFNADSLTVDTSNIVEVRTFVFGRDITTLDDNDLLGNIQLLDQQIDELEYINAKTPLAKLVTKIAQLKDAKAKIVELLGGAPVEQASPAIDADETKPKRVRRTKAEIEADARRNAEDNIEEKATPVPPAPPAARATETDVDDLDLE